MTGTFRTGAIALLVALLAASGSAAQDATPEVEPMPYGDYVAALEQFSAATSSATTDHLGPASTVADVVAAYEESVALVEVDQQRLFGIVPEPCYAAAHEQVFAYRESAIELLEEALPLMAESGALADIFGLFEAIDADLLARHPTAYVEDPDSGGGFEGSYRNILAALATCDGGAIADSQRVEFADEGVAITLSADWRALPRDMVGDGAVIGAFHSDGSGTCFVARFPSGGTNTIDDVLEAWIPTGYWAELPGPYSTTRVETAAGDAASVTFWEQRADLSATYWNAIYLIPAVDWLYSVQCTAERGLHTPPADDWLSIAKTFEFLPAEE